MAESRLHQLSRLGQSVWIDYLSRDLLRSGELARAMREDAVVGVPSTPTIFQKAIAAGDVYDEQLREVLKEERDPKEIFIRLAAKDIGDACDLLRPVWDGGGGQNGYVSLEVDPTLAADTAATIEEAQRLHELVDRPNLFVKIPATKEGLPAIEEMIARGRSINVTLIFSLQRYAEVAEAYIRGLERLVAGGGDPSRVASVASFCVSRVDTEADRRLEEGGGPKELAGTLAIANAKLAYQPSRYPREQMTKGLEALEALELSSCVLLGMGGSSLAPEVLRRAAGASAFHVLDSTHPAAIRSLEKLVDPDDTLFLVSSKSGTTLETRCHLDYFWRPGRHLAAITDPGSELEQLGRERGFAAVIQGEPTIGGRYSALSPFGLVPAALLGLDVRGLVDAAVAMQEACRSEESPGLELGLELGSAWREV